MLKSVSSMLIKSASHKRLCPSARLASLHFSPQLGRVTASWPMPPSPINYSDYDGWLNSCASRNADEFRELQKADAVGLTIAHDINPHSNLTFATNFSFIPATQGNTVFGGQTGNSDFFSASVNYGYRLTREWRTNLSYTYNERDDQTGTARSSTILLALSRDFTLMGNPDAINQAERERARQRAQQTIGYAFPNFH